MRVTRAFFKLAFNAGKPVNVKGAQFSAPLLFYWGAASSAQNEMQNPLIYDRRTVSGKRSLVRASNTVGERGPSIKKGAPIEAPELAVRCGNTQAVIHPCCAMGRQSQIAELTLTRVANY